jgi:hypothetical protein
MSREQGRCWFSAGRMLWKPIRDSIMVLRAQGWNLEVEEGGGFFSRLFVVRGDAQAVLALFDYVKQFERDDP